MEQTTYGALTLNCIVILHFYFYNFIFTLTVYDDVLVNFKTVQPSSQPIFRTPLCLSSLAVQSNPFLICMCLGSKAISAGTWGLPYKSSHTALHSKPFTILFEIGSH